MTEKKKRGEISIKATDEVLRGVYANNMVVSHTGEEFFLDFINVFPPRGILNARVIISPGHMKRMIRARPFHFLNSISQFISTSYKIQKEKIRKLQSFFLDKRLR